MASTQASQGEECSDGCREGAKEEGGWGASTGGVDGTGGTDASASGVRDAIGARGAGAPRHLDKKWRVGNLSASKVRFRSSGSVSDVKRPKGGGNQDSDLLAVEEDGEQMRPQVG